MNSLIRSICFVLSAAAAAASPAFAQNDTRPLRANPFDRPAFVVDLGQAESALLPESPIELELRATMVASHGALANINGELLRVGQRIADYRVVHISEGRAVLRNSSGDLVLDVYRNQRGDDEDELRE